MKDITGMKWGRLTAIAFTRRVGTIYYWIFKCDCGKEKELNVSDVKSGKIRSCGCLVKEAAKMRRISPSINNLNGRRFGRLTVIAFHGYSESKKSSALWMCKCDCGKNKVVKGGNLTNKNRSSQTLSCGCLREETLKTSSSLQAIHFEGTHIGRIKNKKIAENNTSGKTGVIFCKKYKKWNARISFKGKRYCLGYHAQLSDAIEARKKAESIVHDEFVEYYEKLKEEIQIEKNN